MERYEAIVADHQQYTRAVLDAQEFLESTHSAIEMWGRAHGELVTIKANLDKLKVRHRKYTRNDTVSLPFFYKKVDVT